MAAYQSLFLVLPLLSGTTGSVEPAVPTLVQDRSVELFNDCVAEFCAAREALALSRGTPALVTEPPALRLCFLPRMWHLAEAGHLPAVAWILRHFALAPDDIRDPATLKLALYRRLLPACATESWLASPELDVLASLEEDLASLGGAATSELAHAVYLGVSPSDAARRLRALSLEASALAPLGESDPTKVRAATEVWRRELMRERHGPLTDAFEDAIWRLNHLVRGLDVPDFVASDVDGNEIRLSDFRGKVVVVAFFSLSSEDDRARVAQLSALAKQWQGVPFAVIGVAQDSNTTSFRRACEERELRFPCVYEGGRNGRVAKAWHFDSVPRCLVIDRDGALRYVDVARDELEKSVRLLVHEPANYTAPPNPNPPAAGN